LQKGGPVAGKHMFQPTAGRPTVSRGHGTINNSPAADVTADARVIESIMLPSEFT
jgi:hypothetical protein